MTDETTTYTISRVDIRSFALNQVPRFNKVPHSHGHNELSLLKCLHQPRFVTSSEPLGKCLQHCLASLSPTHISFTKCRTISRNSSSCLVRGGHHCSCAVLQHSCNNLQRYVKLDVTIANNVQCVPSSLHCHTIM